MKIAIATTTINIPHALTTYRAFGPDVVMFVAGDKNTPPEVREFCDSMEYVHFDDEERTRELDYACSEIIGWQTICRRNIALLEAVKSGAELIVFLDDDNMPLAPDYFERFERLFEVTRSTAIPPYGALPQVGQKITFDGIKVTSPSGWFDGGQLLTPPVRHRGIPIGIANVQPHLHSIIDANIGIAAGLWIGDADVNAVDRIANPPAVHSATALALAGVVVDPDTKTVFNAQNVAFIRELAPAMFQAPGLGRADDIFASLITQRIMKERGLHVHFGQPFTACWQDRSKASLLKDLSDEMLLLERTAEFSHWLDGYVFEPGIDTVIDQVRDLYRDLQHCVWWPKQASEAALAFLDDMERVL